MRLEKMEANDDEALLTAKVRMKSKKEECT